MRQYLGNYIPFYTPKFEKQIKKMGKDYKERVKSRIEGLIQDPWHNTEFAKGQHRGKRKIRINRTDRLLFIICEECMALGHKIYQRCSSECDNIPEKALIIGYLVTGHDY